MGARVEVVLQIREKNLQPEQAAQLAQHITSGRIRVAELGGLASVASQEQMVHGSVPDVHAKQLFSPCNLLIGSALHVLRKCVYCMRTAAGISANVV